MKQLGGVLRLCIHTPRRRDAEVNMQRTNEIYVISTLCTTTAAESHWALGSGVGFTGPSFSALTFSKAFSAQ